MKNITKIVSTCFLVLCLTLSLTACKGEEKTTSKENDGGDTIVSNEKEKEPKEKKTKYDTLVLGSTDFNAVFSPFFATTGYDVEITDRTQESLITNNRLGEPASNLAVYETPKEIKDDDGNIMTVYRFKLQDNLKFSDGEPITADDIIFTYKVLCDPKYDGASTIYTTPILGINEYRYDDPNYAEIIEGLKVSSQDVIKEEVEACMISAYESYGAEAIDGYTGFNNPDGLEGEELKKASIAKFIEVETDCCYGTYEVEAIDNKFKELEKKYIEENLSSGTIKVPDIEGIKKVDDLTVEVTIKGVDPKAIWNLGAIEVAPEHYYGEGFKKGDLTKVKEKNNMPIGAGAYKFEKFENNVVTFRANENYYKGEPKIKNLKYQVVSSSNKLETVTLGEVDISDPTASPEMVQNVKDAGLHYELIENLGYGYIGINADRIKDKNVRKGLMHIMNREPAINTYYGELASVIERPMSRVSWAYPENAKSYYEFNSAKALECFEKAGYKQVDKNGTKVLEKNGKQLKIEIGIGGDGIMNHPSAPILTQMKDEMEKLGGVLDISDVDVTILFDRLDAKDWDMWVAAWQATIDPDMYQTYHSNGPSNHYCIKNEELDQIILDARSTNDIEKRKGYYSKALDIIMDEAVEMPVYQRKNMFIFNPEVIDVETLPKDMTPFYGYFKEIQTLELK
ncbi:ABC transporter substrate-binding protein [Vallitalea sp.]|jgi:ABC-type transport system substrate-binding protein|uniref:ABC transporter substrate-binding protein n=1 Tax=Vallitalea sp. TaxID=1882829 RepID=UPI0025E12921|nr:ABC transporter substrate-binding protein [Vallitalea sp.]MCT4686404.1 ABC transporter substrate-binding protein [Vallitalea sp.]